MTFLVIGGAGCIPAAVLFLTNNSIRNRTLSPVPKRASMREERHRSVRLPAQEGRDVQVIVFGLVRRRGGRNRWRRCAEATNGLLARG